MRAGYFAVAQAGIACVPCEFLLADLPLDMNILRLIPAFAAASRSSSNHCTFFGSTAGEEARVAAALPFLPLKPWGGTSESGAVANSCAGMICTVDKVIPIFCTVAMRPAVSGIGISEYLLGSSQHATTSHVLYTRQLCIVHTAAIYKCIQIYIYIYVRVLHIYSLERNGTHSRGYTALPRADVLEHCDRVNGIERI